jgi:hypothetical protein
VTPQRIQRQRRKGWRMQANTVSVTRPGRWGNRYYPGSGNSRGFFDADMRMTEYDVRDPRVQVMWFREWLTDLRANHATGIRSRAGMTARVPCCVPFCRRTTRRDDETTEWLCGKHYQTVPKAWRRVRTRAKRRHRLAIEAGVLRLPGPNETGFRVNGLWRTYDDAAYAELVSASRANWRTWRRCKRHAIERATGL